MQLGTVRYLGRFLENPAAVPAQVVRWTAREIGVSASLDLPGYGEGELRWSHQAEIRRIYGYRPFSSEGVEPELVEWLRARAWATGESSRALFTRASKLLMGRRILLPGWSTLWRLVGPARESADERGWNARRHADRRAARKARAAAHVTAGHRVTDLERFRMAPVEPAIKGLIAALERLRELCALADGLGGLEALPHARLRVLMVAAERQRGGELADRRESRRLATLMAFAITAAERGQDDALEHFDRLHGDLLLRAAPRPLQAGAVARRWKRSMTPGGPSGACSVLLDDTIGDPVADAVFAAVARDCLAAAVTAIGQLTRSP